MTVKGLQIPQQFFIKSPLWRGRVAGWFCFRHNCALLCTSVLTEGSRQAAGAPERRAALGELLAKGVPKCTSACAEVCTSENNKAVSCPVGSVRLGRWGALSMGSVTLGRGPYSPPLSSGLPRQPWEDWGRAEGGKGSRACFREVLPSSRGLHGEE